MEETNLISIEIGKGCDLAKVHTKCPISDVDRYGDLDISNPITDDKLIDIISQSYSMGFKGEIAFHYYNEPLLYADRVFSIIERVRDLFPESRFFLNTNGNFIHKHLDKMYYFSTINLSNYEGKNWDWLKEHLHKNASLRVFDFGLDSRKENFKNYRDTKPCNRPYKEFIIDYYGNAHLCCMDWKGQVELGNVVKGDFKMIFDKFVDYRKKIGSDPMDDAPDICKKCIGKSINKGV